MDALLEKLRALQGSDTIASALREPRSLFALLALVAVVLYGLSVGRTRALVSLLSIYVAYVLTSLFPFSGWLEPRIPDRYRLFTDVGLFLALYLLVFSLISHSIRTTRLSLGEISLVQVVVISVVQMGLLASIGSSLLAPEYVARYLGPVAPVVSGGIALWLWAAASLAILPLMRARRRE